MGYVPCEIHNSKTVKTAMSDMSKNIIARPINHYIFEIWQKRSKRICKNIQGFPFKIQTSWLYCGRSNHRWPVGLDILERQTRLSYPQFATRWTAN